LLVPTKSIYLPIFVGRQTIYDAGLNVWGYELLFRSGGQEQFAQFKNAEQATAAVIIEGFSIATASLPRGRKIFINYPQELLLKEAPVALPRDDCVIEVLETIDPCPELMNSLRNLKEFGYIIALDDYVGQPEYAPLLELADIIKVEILGRSWKEIIKISQMLRQYNCLLLAEKIENKDSFDLAISLGFSFFQGFYFSRPEILSGRSIPTATVNRLRLIHEMSGHDFEMGRVAKIISQDTGMSFRLLKQINSVSYSFRHKVRSIAQAVTLMGTRALKQWVMLAMLADIDSTGRAQELLFRCVHRARFLEMLALEIKDGRYDPDSLFLLGLFSNLDAMLNLPMEEITKHLPLEKDLNAALLGEKNNLRQWIELSAAVENGDWNSLDSLLHLLHLDEQNTAVKHIQAADWAVRMLDIPDAGEPRKS